MATFGFRGRTIGDPFDGPQAQDLAGAVFRNLLGLNREPADVVPIASRKMHGATDPVQVFGFHSKAGLQANDPDVIAVSARSVPLAQRFTHRAGRRGWE